MSEKKTQRKKQTQNKKNTRTWTLEKEEEEKAMNLPEDDDDGLRRLDSFPLRISVQNRIGQRRR